MHVKLKMLVENPPKLTLWVKIFFVKSARFFVYGLQFIYLTVPCFFCQFAFRFQEKRSPFDYA